MVAALHAPHNYEILEEFRKSSSKFLSVVLKFNVNVKVNDVLMFFKKTDENTYVLILNFQYLEIHKYLALRMKTKQTEKSSRKVHVSVNKDRARLASENKQQMQPDGFSIAEPC